MKNTLKFRKTLTASVGRMPKITSDPAAARQPAFHRGLTRPPPGGSMAAEQPVRLDFEWVRRLEVLFATTPVAHRLEDALAALVGCSAPPGGTALNLDALTYVVARQRQLWLAEGMLTRVGLPLSFMDFALAIYVYTLERPQ
eukprot:4723139-Prymnesium_polylepis.1